MIATELYGCHFEYDGVLSRTYGLIFVSGTTDRFTKLAGSGKPHTFFDKRNSANHIVGMDYADSPISFDAEIICEHEIGLEKSRRREVERWLFEKPYYAKLYIDMSDDIFGDSYELVNGEQKRLYLNCRFVNPEKMEYNGGIVGYKFTIECDSRLAWQDPISQTIELNHLTEGQSSTIYINLDTDLNDYTYPVVTITMGSVGGNIRISNMTDNVARVTDFMSIDSNSAFKIDNSINYISSGNYIKMSRKNFIRLLNGENKIFVVGNVKSITFEWQNRRFL